ncbi:MAG TPA: enoyl-CoA hydratase-related protein [Acidimicrobiales bacterium]
MDTLVIRERTGHIEVLTLNRPEAANSLNPALMSELGAVLGELLEDDDARAIVLTGSGPRVFCAGMDLTLLGEWDGDDGPPGGKHMASLLGGSYPKPLIAAVNGAAVGGGLELVMGCDLAVAAEHARFGLPEVKRGLFPAGGGTLLSTRIPLALALEMGLTGRLIDAPAALTSGLVNRVVPSEELLDVAVALAGEVAANGPLGVQLTKQLMRAAVAIGPAAGWASSDQQHHVFGSKDAAEGAAAFLDKREPKFTGR